MLWFKNTVVVVALLGLAPLGLAGCGFTPLYASRDGGRGAAEFARIQILPIADRRGQILRNHLLDLLTPVGPPASPFYILEVTLRDSTQHLGIRKSALATRANYYLTASYRLKNANDNRILSSISTQVVSGYNILSSDYATLVAEKDARVRALREIAEQIRRRLGIYFSRPPAERARDEL